MARSKERRGVAPVDVHVGLADARARGVPPDDALLGVHFLEHTEHLLQVRVVEVLRGGRATPLRRESQSRSAQPQSRLHKHRGARPRSQRYGKYRCDVLQLSHQDGCVLLVLLEGQRERVEHLRHALVVLSQKQPHDALPRILRDPATIAAAQSSHPHAATLLGDAVHAGPAEHPGARHARRWRGYGTDASPGVVVHDGQEHQRVHVHAQVQLCRHPGPCSNRS